jgi:hypothetical protein
VRVCGAYLLLAALYSAGIGLWYVQVAEMPLAVAIVSAGVWLCWTVVAATAGIGLLFLAHWARRLAVGALGIQVAIIVLGLSPLLKWAADGTSVMFAQAAGAIALATAVPAGCIYCLTRPQTRSLLGDSAYLASASTQQGAGGVISDK